MREDWNERAREDAHYYVAFGQREQDSEEFFATASDTVRELEGALKRLPESGARNALEIGCGPGRLMRPMSRHFAEIHGVDISDEMIGRARVNLAGIEHAHPHTVSGSDLSLFDSDYFDFVYSFAVFQHIPSAEVVFSYLRETVRVLKPGGVAHLQLNGLPKSAKAYTTWDGFRMAAEDVRRFTREQDVRLLSLNGVETQYMWTTWQKPLVCRIRWMSNFLTNERAIPATGQLACASLTIENLPAEARDMNALTVRVAELEATVCYIGEPGYNDLTQVNAFLPDGVRTGMVPVSLECNGRRLCPDAWLRVIPPGPGVPFLTAVSDGVNLRSYQRIQSRTVKVTIEEVQSIDAFRATVDGIAVIDVDTFCTDPRASRYEVNFRLPKEIERGGHVLDVWLGRRRLLQIGIVVE